MFSADAAFPFLFTNNDQRAECQRIAAGGTLHGLYGARSRVVLSLKERCICGASTLVEDCSCHPSTMSSLTRRDPTCNFDYVGKGEVRKGRGER
jgi:hypothetical protein